MTGKSRTRNLSIGFTLVELLVAMAVLAIIVVAASQILSLAAKLTTLNNKHMDANDQARMVFDRMANDFARITHRPDADFIFYKCASATPATIAMSDAMYFYTEGASYFDTSTFNNSAGYSFPSPEKNALSLVGYRINDHSDVNAAGWTSATPPTQAQDPNYYQLERLGKALSWDGGPYVSGQPNMAVFLTYPPPGTDAATGDPTGLGYSTAYFNSTLYGAYSNHGVTNGQLPSAVGTWTINHTANSPVDFNNSTDSSYRSIGSQVFRFELAFQLKDGTFSDKPMMVYTGSGGLPGTNGVASGFTLTGGALNKCPVKTDDSSSSSTADGGPFAVGSRWWDPKRQIGYICLDATPGYAVWHEIGIQDVAAVYVTIAVIDKQGLTFLNARGGTLLSTAAKLPDYSPTVIGPKGVTGNPDYLLDSTNTKSWTYALLPGQAVSAIGGINKLPQAMISQIRVYQRCFYLNNF